jgi:hypothetical protein
MGILLEHLRSCAAAPWNTFGMYTAFVTLNPCPLNAHLLYKMAGHDYTFQADGCPNGHPDLRERWSIICNNPAYCAMYYFQLYMQEFYNVYLGWPQGAPTQVDPNCMFGPVSAFFYNTECTGTCSGQLIKIGLYRVGGCPYHTNLMCCWAPLSPGKGDLHAHMCIIQPTLQLTYSTCADSPVSTNTAGHVC